MIEVELQRNNRGVWEVCWDDPDGAIHIVPGATASEVAAILLRLGNFKFVRGLGLPMK